MSDEQDKDKADLIPRAEARKAFEARDELKQKLRALEDQGLIITVEQKAAYAKFAEDAKAADEKRKRDEGEFDKWRNDISRQHEETVAAERQKAAEATARLHATMKDHAFASASEWFGGAEAKTILTPAIAAAYFGRYVTVEADDAGVERLIVRDPDGHIILDGKTSRPAPFAQAIGALIKALPDKDSILRGSGKTGSGNSGGSAGRIHEPDLETLTRLAAAGDADAIKQLQQRQRNLGGLQMGTVYAGKAS